MTEFQTFPRKALKIVGTADGGFDLLMKFAADDTVVTVAHVNPGAFADVYAQAFACCPLAFHLIEDVLELGGVDDKTDMSVGMRYGLEIITVVRPAMLLARETEF